MQADYPKIPNNFINIEAYRSSYLIQPDKWQTFWFLEEIAYFAPKIHLLNERNN